MQSLFDANYCAWKNWNPESFGHLAKIDEAYFDLEFARTGITRSSSLLSLEIGFGSGTFLSYLKKFGGRTLGVEVNSTLLAEASKKGYEVFSSVEMVPTDLQFDLIAAFDVLEHLSTSELIVLFSKVRSMLKCGGVFLARFPNGDSPFGRIYQHGDLTHVSTIGSYKLEELAKMNKFEILFCGAPAIPWRSVGLLRGIKRLISATLKSVIEFVCV